MAASKKADCCGGDMTGLKKTAATRVFEAARDLFYHRGIRAVGVDEIVCKAGVTKPSLYRAFASKDDLIAACLEESGRESRAALESVLEEGERIRATSSAPWCAISPARSPHPISAAAR
ncbi:TetR/AcrR family transcriptional regulator [Rhizorhabdus histidinilytica]